MKKSSQLIMAGVTLIVLSAAVYIVQTRQNPPEDAVLSFQSCVKAGFPIREIYPRQCATTDGRIYTEDITVIATYNNASTSDIVVELPPPGAVTGKSFTITGKARGYWYFEASFPVTVIDEQGNTLIQTFAQATGDWMTDNFVPFSKTINIPSTYTGKATVLIMNDNPSGLPENEKSLSFPITIK